MSEVHNSQELFSSLLPKISSGDVKSLARAITICENSNEQLDSLIPTSDSTPQIIGITGAPGVGKSTTVSALLSHLRNLGKTIAVIAVDPSSPITGGALLGDRIRLTEHFLDQGVFIRSLATRGHLGGLSAATLSSIKLATLAGFDYIIIETVGVGQSEVEIMKFAQTVLVILAPGMGDGIQASKAGILEIGHIYLVNKSDRDGAKETAAELEKSLYLIPQRSGWKPEILLGAMENSVGVQELADSITRHQLTLKK